MSSHAVDQHRSAQLELTIPQFPQYSSDSPQKAGQDTLTEGKTTPESRAEVQDSANDVPDVPRWYQPRIHLWRTLASFLGFFIMGSNDAVYGALIPYLESYYQKDYTTISLIFLSPLVGYTTSALLNNQVHIHYGQRGVAFLGAGTRLISYIVVAIHPPYPVLVLAFILAGFGNGLEDAGWNAMFSTMRNSNQLLGLLHGFYGLGGTVAPLIATTMIAKGGLQWYYWYYLMIGLTSFELLFAVTAFWSATGTRYQETLTSQHGPDAEKGGRMREALSNRVTWICAFFLLTYVGIEVAIGGWTVTYELRVRRASPFDAGMSVTGYWAGMTVGRVVLGFVTPLMGERLAIFIYVASAIVAHLIFWLVPVFAISATGVAFVGFFLGPFFPAAVSAAAKLLPKHLHVGAIGFAAAFGAGGACILPFAVGGIAQAKGVQVLMPIVLAMLVLDGGIWALLPSLKRRVGVDEEGEGDSGEKVG